MEERGKIARPPAVFARTATILTAILIAGCLAASPLMAAQITVNTPGDFKNTLESVVSAGDTVVIGPGVGVIDLAGTSVKITAPNVTLQGQSSFDLGASLRSQAGSLLSTLGAGKLDMSRGALDGKLTDLSNFLQSNAPATDIYNSAAATGTHAGISAPSGGFSLKNMTLKGTQANMDSASGASKYMGLIGSTFDRLDNPADGQGMGLIENVAFIDNVVKSTGAVHHVGNTLFFTQRRYDAAGNYVAGSDRIETLDGIVGSVFVGNKMYSDMTASVGNRDVGGGGAGWVNLTKLESSLFADNFVQGHHAFGGGLFVYSLGAVTDSVFHNNIIESDHDAYGGGIMSSGGIAGISRSIFVGNEARGLEFGLGRTAGVKGGAVYTAPRTGNGIGLIDASLFAYNRAYNNTGEEAMGGAVYVALQMDRIKDSVFYGNSAESNGDAFGGAIALDVNGPGMQTTISDSLFMNNFVLSKGAGGGGALSINTTTAAATQYTLNIEATNGAVTEFSGNTHNGEANSIYIGKHAETGTNQTDVTLNINAARGGLISLLDPIRVDLNNGKTFTMVNKSAGRFVWDGINDLSADGGSTLLFQSGSNALFEKGFHLHSTAGNPIGLNLDNGAKLSVVLSGRNQNMALFEDTAVSNDAGASLTAQYYGFVDYQGSWVVFDHDAAAQGTNLALMDQVDRQTGAASHLSLSTSGNKTLVNLDYRAPSASFAAAGPNARRGSGALQEVWSRLLVPNLNGEQQAAYFSQILGDLRNFTAEAFATQGTVALSSSYWVTQQALKSDRRSWFSTNGACGPSYGEHGGKVRFWAEYIGSYINQDERSGHSGYDVQNNGAIVGVSYDFANALSLGGYFSASSGETDYDELRADIDTDILQVGVFAAYKHPDSGLGVTLDLSYAWMDNDTTRKFMDGRYTGSFDQSVFGLGLKFDYGLKLWENGCLSPHLGLRYQHLEQDSFTESGNGLFPLHVKSTDGDMFTTTLGLDLTHNFVFENAVLTPQLSMAWRHEFGDRDISTNYNIAGMGVVTSARSLKTSADALDLGAAITLQPLKTENISVGINAGYYPSFSANRVEHTFYGGLELKF